MHGWTSSFSCLNYLRTPPLVEPRLESQPQSDRRFAPKGLGCDLLPKWAPIAFLFVKAHLLINLPGARRYMPSFAALEVL